MGRTLHVYDFDDTLANSEVSVYVKLKNGKTVKLSSHQFAKYKLEPGDFFDFSEFNKLIKSATPIDKFVNQLKQSLANPQVKTTILTARALAYPVKYWLKTVAGVDAYVVAVAGSNPKLKADWIENQVKKGYTNVKFVDDSQKNLDAVGDRLAAYPNINLQLINSLYENLNEKSDRCKRIADRKYDKPSAYKSGAIVRCRKGNIWKDLKENETLNEYSANIINQLTDTFKQENPSLSNDIIQVYINRFAQLKNSPKISKKDITKYSWKELETVVDSNQPKRIKAGKINDGKPSNDANLVYNKDKLRIYVGKTREACIKYGNGYSFCISARGEDNMYYQYRYGQGGTPYFVFDDTKTSEQDVNGKFIDPKHLLVIFIYEPEEGSEYGEGYSITNANNSGEDEFNDFNEIEKYYPRLKGLENIFQNVELDPKEKTEYKLKEKYNNKIDKMYSEEFNGPYYNSDKYYVFSNIESANNNIDELINNKTPAYRFNAKLKPTANEDHFLGTSISQNRLGDLKKEYEGFIKDALSLMYDGPENPENSIKDWDITYKKLITDETQPYIKKIKKIVDEYRNELSKLRLVREQLNLLTEKQKETLRTWFKRKGAPGKEGGWVDCNTCRDGKCKSCGRKAGEQRAKYPSCRPTPAQCKTPGKGKKWGKTK